MILINFSYILYGSISYTYLKNDNDNPKFILVLSDNHSKLPYCNNYNMTSNWLTLHQLQMVV
jgi:hypothetical protein